MGTRVSETEKNGQRTVVWKSDYIDAMLATLDAARRHYSEWFHPFPWRELKISEFPN